MRPSEEEMQGAAMEPAGWDEFELDLLRAGREAAPRATERAVLGALGLDGPLGGPGGQGVTAPPPAPPSSPFAAIGAAPTSSTLVIAKWVGVGVLAAAIPFLLLRPSAPEPVVTLQEPGARPPAPAIAPAEPAPSPAPSPEVAPTEGALSLDQLPSESSGRQGATARPVQATPSSAIQIPAAEESTLAAELLRIKSARALLASGQADATLAELERYRADFPRPRLGSEATVLRIEALVKLGRRAEARALASPLLEPGSLYAERVEALLR